MNGFTYFSPTEIVFGKDSQANTANLVKKHGGKRVFLVYGSERIVQSGLLAEITDQLDKNDIKYMLYSGVKPNPVLSHTREGIKKAIEFDTDFVLAVGGGSVIDEAKAIAHGTKNQDTDIWKYWEKEIELKSSLPIGVVLTIPASGSETSDSAVITNDELNRKRGLSTEFNRPLFAVMNPEFTYTLPKFQISCGIVDIMLHTMERYFTKTKGNQMTDEIAVSLLRVVIENGTAAFKDSTNYEAMSELMWCGSLSHNGITGLGRPSDFSVHQLGHELSAKFDVAHAASLSVMWGAWANYCYKTDVCRFAQYAKAVWDIENDDAEIAAKAGIDKTVEFFKSLDMPVKISQLGFGILSDTVINDLADSCVFYGKRLVGNFQPLNKEDIVKIYQMAKE